MSAIRRQSAVSRGAAERAESRRCGSRSTSRVLDCGHGESTRKSEENFRHRHSGSRKISYQDWTDEESGAYYYEDEESSIVESNTNSETKTSLKNEVSADKDLRSQSTKNHIIDFGAAPVARRYENRKDNNQNVKSKNFNSNNDKKKVYEEFFDSKASKDSKRKGRRSRSASSGSDTTSDDVKPLSHSSQQQGSDGVHNEEQSTLTGNDISFNNATTVSSSSASDTTANESKHTMLTSQQAKTNEPKKRISILEQIMQARTPHRSRGQQRFKHNTINGHPSNGHFRTTPKQSSSKGPQGGKAEYRRRLQKREPLDTRLKHSPYCEPMPKLFIVYTPVAHTQSRDGMPYRDRSAGQRGKKSFPETWMATRKQAKAAPEPAQTRSHFSAGRTGDTVGSYGFNRRSPQRPCTQQFTRDYKPR